MSIIPKGTFIQAQGTSITDQVSKLGRLVSKKVFSVPNSQKESQFKAVAQQKKQTTSKDCDCGEISLSASGYPSFSMAAAQAWNRPEGHPLATLEKPLPIIRSTGEIAKQVGCDRILIGTGAYGTEARLHLASGSIAGTEIRLRATEHGLEASVLLTTEGARSAISGAMSEMATRLRRKGHVVRLEGHSQGRQKEMKHTRKDPFDE